MLVDSHCHLDYGGLAEDLDGVLDRAAVAGVGLMLTIGTRLSHFDGVRTIAEAHDQVWCTVGVHPHEAAAEPDVTAKDLARLARHPKVAGIGETGLDYHYEHSPRADQRRAFRAHIAAAREAGLPVVVHSREAEDDTAAILAEEMAEGAFSGVLHCFSSARPLAEAALDLGLYISFSGIVTFRNSDELREIARDVPLNRLLVETDAPYLAPEPMRGKTNEPAFVAHTAARVAELRGLEREALATATTENFLRLFDRVDGGAARTTP